MPATAHHSWSNCSLMKWFSGCLNRLTSTLHALRRWASASGSATRRARASARDRSTGRSRSSSVDGSRGDHDDRRDRPVRRRVDQQLDPRGDVMQRARRTPSASATSPTASRPRASTMATAWRRRDASARGHSGSSGRWRPPERRASAVTLRRARPSASAALRLAAASAAGQAAGGQVDRAAADGHVRARLVRRRSPSSRRRASSGSSRPGRARGRSRPRRTSAERAPCGSPPRAGARPAGAGTARARAASGVSSSILAARIRMETPGSIPGDGPRDDDTNHATGQTVLPDGRMPVVFPDVAIPHAADSPCQFMLDALSTTRRIAGVAGRSAPDPRPGAATMSCPRGFRIMPGRRILTRTRRARAGEGEVFDDGSRGRGAHAPAL